MEPLTLSHTVSTGATSASAQMGADGGHLQTGEPNAAANAGSDRVFQTVQPDTGLTKRIHPCTHQVCPFPYVVGDIIVPPSIRV